MILLFDLLKEVSKKTYVDEETMTSFQLSLNLFQSRMKLMLLLLANRQRMDWKIVGVADVCEEVPFLLLLKMLFDSSFLQYFFDEEDTRSWVFDFGSVAVNATQSSCPRDERSWKVCEGNMEAGDSDDVGRKRWKKRRDVLELDFETLPVQAVRPIFSGNCFQVYPKS